MKRKLIYRPDALNDLNDAEACTRRAWDGKQAKRYVAALVQDIKALRVSALRHPICDGVHPGLRRKRSGMHHIYYLATKDQVEVLNILHVQRDPGLHLKVETWSDEENE
ncbi:MAG TPA: type II toxin-antitoxin system RelE/ParE family toxin [Sphingomonadaceae bacterium]